MSIEGAEQRAAVEEGDVYQGPSTIHPGLKSGNGGH